MLLESLHIQFKNLCCWKLTAIYTQEWTWNSLFFFFFFISAVSFYVYNFYSFLQWTTYIFSQRFRGRPWLSPAHTPPLRTPIKNTIHIFSAGQQKNNSDIWITVAGNYWRFISCYFIQLLNKLNLKNTVQCLKIYKQYTI